MKRLLGMSLWAGALTVTQLLSSMVLSILLARSLGASGRGDLAFTVSWISVAALVCLLGLPSVLASQRLGFRGAQRAFTELRTQLAVAGVVAGLVMFVVLARAVSVSTALLAVVGLGIVSRLGVSRAVYHASGAHSLSEASGAIEAVGRFALFGAAIVALDTLTVFSAVLLYVGGFGVALMALSFLGRPIRTADSHTVPESIDRPWSRLVGAFRIQSYQQLSGRLFIAFTIFSVDSNGAGYLAVAFAFTEPILNVARLLQPRLMRRGQANGTVLKRMYGVVGAGCAMATALAVSGKDTVFTDRLVRFVFGEEFVPAGVLLAPMAVSIALASVNISMIGVLYRDGRAIVERLAGSMGLLILLVGVFPGLDLYTRLWALGALQLGLSASLMRLRNSADLNLVGAIT